MPQYKNWIPKRPTGHFYSEVGSTLLNAIKAVPYDESKPHVLIQHSWKDWSGVLQTENVLLVPNIAFVATMKLDTFYIGRSAADVVLSDEHDIEYHMTLWDFKDIMKDNTVTRTIDPHTDEVLFTGTWCFTKKGTNYKLKVA